MIKLRKKWKKKVKKILEKLSVCGVFSCKVVVGVNMMVRVNMSLPNVYIDYVLRWCICV